MSARDRRDDELEARLDELDDVLTDLRRDLRESGRDRRDPPRPPSISELLRFTEQYTIPTVIALLETTIRSLELLRGTLRLADPGRGLGDGATADRFADVREGASAGLARSLAELRTALSEADLPEEAASRSIIAEARDLTAEIEARIEEGRREADAARERTTTRRGPDDESGGRERDRGIRIDVTDPDAGAEAGAAGDDPESEPAPEVDVESELESIKRQIDVEEAGADDAAAGDGSVAADDADAGDKADETGADDTDSSNDRDAN